VESQDILQWIDHAELGSTDERMELSRREEYKRSAARLTTQARRELLIFTHDLDPPVYDQAEFLEAVKQLVLPNRSARVWVLLQSNRRVRREGHRLIELSRRLPSRIEIRRVHPDHLDHAENFLVADESGLLQQRYFTRHEGSVCFHSPLAAREHRSFFLGVWDQSHPDSDLRRLHL